MRIVRNTSLQMDEPSGPNNRRFGRVRCESLRCFFADHDNYEAEVLDLSASGMRLRLKRSLGITEGKVMRVALFSSGGAVELPIKVVWMKRGGFRRFELGVTFGDPSEELRQKLSPIMRAAADNYVVYDKANSHH